MVRYPLVHSVPAFKAFVAQIATQIPDSPAIHYSQICPILSAFIRDYSVLSLLHIAVSESIFLPEADHETHAAYVSSAPGIAAVLRL